MNRIQKEGVSRLTRRDGFRCGGLGCRCCGLHLRGLRLGGFRCREIWRLGN